MSLFAPRKDIRIRNFVLKLLNNNCPGLMLRSGDLRNDKRVNLTVVVMVIPSEKGRLQTDRAFTAVTKEFSVNGTALVFDEVHRIEQAVLGFRFEDEMIFIMAQSKHLDPMGGGYWQCGFQLLEIISAGDYPELKSLGF
jgi:hypothetical protein